MSVTRQVYLLCEGSDCPAMTGADTFAHSAQEARQQARQLGWRRVNRQDLCPGCAEKEKRTSE